AAPLLIQLSPRRLPAVPGVRTGDRDRPGTGDPGPPPLARGAPDRALEHPRLRGAVRGPPRRREEAQDPPRRAVGGARPREPGVGLERRGQGPEVRQPERFLRLARAADLQGARARSPRALGRRILPLAPKATLDAARSRGRQTSDRRANRADRGAPPGRARLP